MFKVRQHTSKFIVYSIRGVNDQNGLSLKNHRRSEAINFNLSYVWGVLYQSPLRGWSGLGVSKGVQAGPPKMAKMSIFECLPWTPLKTPKPSYPLKGFWYHTPQTYVRLKLIALLLLWFLRDKPFWSFSPLILYTINFKVSCRTLNMQKVGFFFTWWNIHGYWNGIRHGRDFLQHFWQYDTPYRNTYHNFEPKYELVTQWAEIRKKCNLV